MAAYAAEIRRDDKVFNQNNCPGFLALSARVVDWFKSSNDIINKNKYYSGHRRKLLL